jgi:hypothetical protein
MAKVIALHQPFHMTRSVHPELVARLVQHREDVRQITAGLDDGALGTRTVADKWSLTELVCHIWRVQELFEERIDAMLARDMPRFESYAPENDAGFESFVRSRPGSEAVRGFLRARERFVQRLEGLTDAEWGRQGDHPTFSRFDVEFLIRYMAHHEAHHLYQMFMRRVELDGRGRPSGRPSISN